MSLDDEVERHCASAKLRFGTFEVERFVTEARARGAALEAALAGDPHLQEVLSSWVALVAEGLGLGYLDSAFGRRALWTWPVASLAGVPAPARGAALASVWNLVENLEQGPPWRRRYFEHVLGDELPLHALEPRLESALEGLDREQEGRVTRWVWVDLSVDDPRFLPGPLHWLTPSVVCVHDRHRTAAAGRAAEARGLWLSGAGPIALGPTLCDAALEHTPRAGKARFEVAFPEFGKPITTVDAVEAALTSKARCVLALVTSQRVLVGGP